MGRRVLLLGRPCVDGAGGGYVVRSRKSWALLTYLLLAEHRPSRAQLAALLFDQADDPLGAVRWSLAEVRRALGEGAEVAGDPVRLRLPPGTVVDAEVVTRRSWTEAVALPSLGGQLLEGFTIQRAEAFEAWLLSERHRLVAANEEILREAVLGSMSGGRLDDAIGYAAQLLTLAPLEEDHHALLIRLYRMSGDDAAAERQFAACSELLRRELGVLPGPAVAASLRGARPAVVAPVDRPAVHAALESGQAAVGAGAIATGADALRTAVWMADRTGDTTLRIGSRLVLAETLVHSLRGFDEEGVAALRAADTIALAAGDRRSVAEARAELGYVDFLRGRYDRARRWLSQALDVGAAAAEVKAKATTYLGAVASDQGYYEEALRLLHEAVALSRGAGDLRRAVYGVTMLGRAHLLRGELDTAAEHLDSALDRAGRDHWLSFLPWPQALRGEVQLARGDVGGATTLLEQAFARACRLGDPCWEGTAARGLALVADARGDTTAAFTIVADARRRANRLADPYVWLDGYILDAQCTLGRRHDHPATATWVADLGELASRSGMRELRVRSLLHGAALGRSGDAGAARLLAAELDNPVVRTLAAEAGGGLPGADGLTGRRRAALRR